MFFQQILKPKARDQSIHAKKLFCQRFVKVFDQNRKQMEARNQRTGTPADFTVPW